MPEPLCIGLLAGEASGDQLGAGLMSALRARRPATRFVGVGGAAMRAEGLELLLPSEALTSNGFLEPLRRFPEFLHLRRTLPGRFRAAGVNGFVGIDFNVFNLSVERALKRRGIPVVHYVSPSVYAWRRGRVKTVAAATDRLLALFPFEPPFYAETGLEVVHVGHPLADRLPTEGRPAARAALALGEAPVLAVLPGSRSGELAQHAEPFLQAALLLAARIPGLQVLVALRDAAAVPIIERHVSLPPNVRLVVGDTHRVLTASDVALLKAGTVTLEAMLCGTPMVVAYRLDAFSHAVVSRLLHTPWVALPNLLAGANVVRECLQDAVRPTVLADALEEALGDGVGQRARLVELSRKLRLDASLRAADAVLDLVAERSA